MSFDLFIRRLSPLYTGIRRCLSTSTPVGSYLTHNPDHHSYLNTYADRPKPHRPSRRKPRRKDRVMAYGRQVASWKTALTNYAKTDPTTLGSDVLLHHDDQTMTIYDGYDKAKFHFLVLPRIPFRLTPEDKEAVQRQIEEDAKVPPSAPSVKHGKLVMDSSRPSLKSTRDTVPQTCYVSLADLLDTPYAGVVLQALDKAAKETVSRIQKMMPSTVLPGQTKETADCTWDVNVGFHAVPSMDTLHLHVISNDLVSDRLKNKKHYLSFHPTLGFWLPMSKVLELQASGAKTLPKSPQAYEAMLKGPLVSHYDPAGKTFSKSMPKLKDYLEKQWVEDVKRRRGQQGEGSSIGISTGASSSKEQGVGSSSTQQAAASSSNDREAPSLSKDRKAASSSHDQEAATSSNLPVKRAVTQNPAFGEDESSEEEIDLRPRKR